MSISLAADHRVTDGRAGVRFLAAIRNALQTPEQGEVPFGDQFDFDSMDTLNFAIGLHEQFGIDVPETQYRELASLAKAAAFVAGPLHASGRQPL